MILRYLVIFILLSTVYADDENTCSADDQDVIEKCYERLATRHYYSTFDELNDPERYSRKNLCKAKKVFDKCMSQTVVKRCFNVHILENLSLPTGLFVKSLDEIPYQTILAYFQLDIFCGDQYNAENCTKDVSEKMCHYDSAKCYAEAINGTCRFKIFTLCRREKNCAICDILINEAIANIPAIANGSSSKRMIPAKIVASFMLFFVLILA